MLITVKILKGSECSVEVSEEEYIESVKLKVAAKLGVPPEQQRLVFRGKPLPDDKSAAACGIYNGSKLFLVVKKTDAGSSTSIASAARAAQNTFRDELYQFLRKHFEETDARLVLDQFQLDLHKSLGQLSLDDIERISAARLRKS